MSRSDSLRRIIAGARTIFLGNGLSKGGLMLFEMVLAAQLGIVGFGLYAIAVAVIQTSAAVGVIGLDLGVVQYMAIYAEREREDLQARLVRGALALSVVSGGVIAAAIAGGSEVLAGKVFDKPELAVLLMIAAISIPFETFNLCASAVFRGASDFRKHIIVVDLVRNYVLLFSVPAVFLFDIRTVEILLLYLVGSISGSCVGVVFVWRMFRYPPGIRGDLAPLREVTRFSYPLSFSSLMQLSANKTFIIISGGFLSAREVGALAVAMRFTLVLDFIRTALVLATPVEFARLFFSKQKQALEQLVRSITNALLVMGVLVSLPILADPARLVGLMDRAYSEYAWVVWALVAATLGAVAMGPIGQLLVSCHQRRAIVYLSGLDALMQFGVGLPLIWKFGLVGAVWGQAVRLVGIALVRCWTANLLLRIRTLGAGFVVLVLASALGVALARAAAYFYPGWGGYLAGCLVGVLVLAAATVPILKQGSMPGSFGKRAETVSK